MVKHKGWEAACALRAAAFASACGPAWLIWQYGVDVPFLDQWGVAHFFPKLAEGSLTLSDLFEQQNEYRQFFPNLIFVATGWLTRWDVRYEMLISFLLACLVAFNIQCLGAYTIAAPLRRGVLYLLASLFIFSAIQFENWVFGVQVVYFMPVACVTSQLLLAYNKKVEAPVLLIACACLAVVGIFSSPNGLLCWVILPLALLAVRPEMRRTVWRWLPLWVLGMALCVAAYAYGYRSPVLHPSTSIALQRPVDAALYFVSLLGGPFAVGRWPLVLAFISGAFALSAYLLLCVYLIKFKDDCKLIRRTAPWMALGAYSLGTAAMVTVGRLGFGVSQSLSTRYTTFTLYLFVALVYMLPCVLENAYGRGYFSVSRRMLLRRVGALATGAFVLAHLTIFALVLRHNANEWRRGLLRAKACLLFIESAPDESCLARGLYPDVRLLRERVEALAQIGYLRPPLVRNGQLRDLAASADCSDRYGSFELLSVGGDQYRASGHAWLPERGDPADVVVLAYGPSDEEQTAFALAEPSVDREGAHGDKAHWLKVFSVDPKLNGPQLKLTAWAFDAEGGHAYRLCGMQTTHPHD